MDLYENWQEIKQLFRSSFKSSFHFAVSTITDNGEPHVTPIGSLILGEPGEGVYFEKFTKQLPKNIRLSNRVCVLAVNSSMLFWIKSLLKGRYEIPPAVRLYGEAKELRPATEQEVALWRKRVRSVSFTKGHKLMWSSMNMVREIKFDRVEPVNIGRMTYGNWREV